MASGYALEGSWRILSFIIAFLSISISIILLMASRLFSATKLEQTAKSEIVFAVSTLILVLFVASVLPVAEEAATEYIKSLYLTDWELIEQNAKDINGNPLTMGWSDEHGLSLIDIVIAQLNGAASCSRNFLDLLYWVDMVVQAVLSIVMEVIMSELTTGFFMNFFSERITTSTNIITFYMIIYFVTYHILMFLKHFGLFFFTVGVLLRAFPPTRGAGAFIMALTIGLYFVFPMAYALMAVTFSEGIPSPWLCDIADLPDVDTSTGGTLDVKKGPFQNNLDLQYYSNRFMQILNQVNSFINSLSILLCFLPILSFMVTLSFVLSASSFFGATIPEVGKGLVKLL